MNGEKLARISQSTSADSGIVVVGKGKCKGKCATPLAEADKWHADGGEQIRKVTEQTAAPAGARGWLAFQRRGERIASEEPAPPGVEFEWKIK